VIFIARQHRFSFPRPAMVMGVVNVTPDSFSDGGQFLDPEAAAEHAMKLADEGAEIIDIGGESTRPQAKAVSETEELGRVLPVLERLRGRLETAISIDTRKPAVARAALEAGASIVNDVEASRIDSEMWEIVSSFGAGYIAMHMQGMPESMQQNPVYTDVVGEVAEFFGDCLVKLRRAGVNADHVMLDVGIGFGKRLEHNLQLLARLDEFRKFARPLLIGVSRKSFIGKLLSVEVGARLPASLACSCWAVQAGANVIRSHDVAATVQSMRMMEAILRERGEKLRH